MELNWSTFALEIVNFLILVWLLARFLYRPVMNIIDRRQQEIRKQLSAADAARKEAESLRQNHQDTLTAWDREKTAARKQLQDVIAAERRQLLEEMQRDIDQEREKAGILNERQMEDAKNNMARAALQQGAIFCSRLFSRLADPELEAAIVDMVIADLDTLPPAQREQLKKNHGANSNGIIVYSAFSVTDQKKAILDQKLAAVTGTSVRCSYKHAPELIAGLRIKVGAWQLQANLQDELKFFADPDHTLDTSER